MAWCPEFLSHSTRLELNPQNAHYKKLDIALVISALGRWRHSDPWDSLVGQPRLISKLQANQ